MNRLTLVFVLLACCGLVAQPQPTGNTSRVTFERRWPAANPKWFELVFQSDGSATYRSLPHEELNSASDDPAPEPYEFSFTLSPQSRRLIFAVAPGLPRLQDSLDKRKVASTGTKTLHYEDGTGKSSTISYNFSSSPELTRLTALMQGISESIELSKTLQFQVRFDKLALDATLRNLEDLISTGQLSESQLLDPVLQRISDDPAIMNIARQRARHILQSPPVTKLK
jgi:hypothetical protein